MRKIITIICMMIISYTNVYSQWVNGQNASYVIGQSNFTSVGTISPSGIAVDDINQKLYSVDYCNHAIYRYDLPITSDNPSPERTFGIPNTSGTTRNTLNNPVSVTVDDNGRLYVSDGANNRILYWNSAYSDGSNAPDADGVIGQTDYTTSTSGLTDRKFNFLVDAGNLYGCAGGSTYGGYIYSYSNHLFVSDAGNNRVLRIDNNTNASVVYGQVNFVSNSTGLTSSTLNKPMGIAVAKGYLYIADKTNNRILRFDGAVANNINGSSANAVYGQTSFTTSINGRTATTLDIPIGLAIDGKDRLYINDSNNGRVVTIDNANTTNHASVQTDFSNVLGQANFTTYSASITQSTVFAGTTGIAVSIQNRNLFIGNTGAKRILVFGASAALPLTLTNIYQLNIEINYTNNDYAISSVSLELSEDGISYITYNTNIVGYGKFKIDISSIPSNYKYYRLKQVDESGAFYTNMFSFNFIKKYYYNDGYLDINGTDISATYTLYDINGVVLSHNDISNQTIDFKKSHHNSNILLLKMNIKDNSNDFEYFIADKIIMTE